MRLKQPLVEEGVGHEISGYGISGNERKYGDRLPSRATNVIHDLLLAIATRRIGRSLNKLSGTASEMLHNLFLTLVFGRHNTLYFMFLHEEYSVYEQMCSAGRH